MARVCPLYPVSKRCFKLMAERLDSIAASYHAAAMVAEVYPEQQLA